jgi:hypothetical protein
MRPASTRGWHRSIAARTLVCIAARIDNWRLCGRAGYLRHGLTQCEKQNQRAHAVSLIVSESVSQALSASTRVDRGLPMRHVLFRSSSIQRASYCVSLGLSWLSEITYRPQADWASQVSDHRPGWSLNLISVYLAIPSVHRAQPCPGIRDTTSSRRYRVRARRISAAFRTARICT